MPALMPPSTPSPSEEVISDNEVISDIANPALASGGGSGHSAKTWFVELPHLF